MTLTAMRGAVSVDQAAVRAAKHGDPAALEALLNDLAHKLLPLALALSGGRGDADVLVGDALSRVYERLDQLEDPKAVLGWARRILVHRFLDERRWSLRRPQCSIETVEIASGGAPMRPELLDLRAAVARLSKRDRALLVLHYWRHLSIKDCADELGIPEGTVKSRLSTALARLRRDLGEDA